MSSAASPFPSRALTLWVPWAAGGATDVSLRLLADLAGRSLGQQVIVNNRAGAGGTLAMPLLQSAEPDGYTIAQMPESVFGAPFSMNVGWDPVRDVTPIIQVAGVTFGIWVPRDSPFHALADLLAFARAQPGHLSVATNGVGTAPHAVLEQLFSARGLGYIHVPYKGAFEQSSAVASGQVMAGAGLTGMAATGGPAPIRLLVTFGEQRSPRWPEVPTLRESGFDIVASSPYGLCGPRGMAAPVVQALHAAFKAALFEPAFQRELARLDQVPAYLGPADYGRHCAAEFMRARRVAVSASRN